MSIDWAIGDLQDDLCLALPMLIDKPSIRTLSCLSYRIQAKWTMLWADWQTSEVISLSVPVWTNMMKAFSTHSDDDAESVLPSFFIRTYARLRVINGADALPDFEL